MLLTGLFLMASLACLMQQAELHPTSVINKDNSQVLSIYGGEIFFLFLSSFFPNAWFVFSQYKSSSTQLLSQVTQLIFLIAPMQLYLYALILHSFLISVDLMGFILTEMMQNLFVFIKLV